MRRPLLLFLFCLSAAIAVLYALDPAGKHIRIFPSGDLYEESETVRRIEGTVSSVSVKDSYAAVTLNIGREKVLIRLKVSNMDLMVYDLVGRHASATGIVQLPDGRRNPGCFDYRLYLKGRGIYSIMNVSRYRLTAGSVRRPILHFLSLSKGKFFQAVRPYMDEQSFQIVAGLLFGETSYMDEDLYEQFRMNGIAHVLAVSGLHVGLLYSVILKILGSRRSLLSTSIVVTCLVTYAALSNFSVSVLRASLMAFLHIISRHLDRRYDMICAASFSAIVFLIINPWQLFDCGFQLSFAAAYSMGIALPWAVSKGIEISDKYKKKWIFYAFGVLSPCIMVQLGMTPLIMFHFLSFSPVGILLNPLAVLLAGMLLPAGLACYIISLFFSGIPLIGASGIAQGFARLLKILSDSGTFLGGSFYCPAPTFSMLILYYMFFFWFFSETRVVLSRRNNNMAIGVVLSLMAASGILLPKALGFSEHTIPWKHDTHAVTFVDVGQGDCTHFNINGFNLLIDGGGSIYGNIARDRLRPYLLKNGIDHIDLAVITHEDIDHSLGIRQLEDLMDIRKVIVLGRNNEDCGICMIETDGIRVLMMADAGFDIERELCSRYADKIACDILKVGHHGSAYSTSEELLDTSKPEFAVISCGKNNPYGHPADRVIELMANSGIIYARTDETGAVYLKENRDGTLVFENAAKDKQWHIQTVK